MGHDEATELELNLNCGAFRAHRLLKLALVASSVLIVALTFLRWIQYGCKAGNFIHPYFPFYNLSPLWYALPSALLLAALPAFFVRSLLRRTWLLIFLTLICGTLSLVAIRSAYYFPMGAVVRSDRSSSFWSPTLKYSAREVLEHYNEIVSSLPQHARSNMPGKMLLFHFLVLFTKSPAAVGWLILISSNLAGVLVYLLCRELDFGRLASFYALLFYLFLPSRIYLAPIPNILSPALIVLALYLFVRFLKTKRKLHLIFMGALFYVLLLYEPLPFVTGIVFLALIGYFAWKKRLGIPDFVAIAVYPISAFLLVHALMYWTFHFDCLKTFQFLAHEATAFNAMKDRSYSIWIVHNLKDFFVNTGAATTVLMLATWYQVARQRTMNLATVMLISITAVLLVTDLLGVNRGETTRLWIFLMALFQIPLAFYCRRQKDPALPWIVVLANVFQTVICLNQVAFVIP